MPGRLAIDFGTSNTVIAVWDETRKEGVPLYIREYSRLYDESFSLIPSLIHYAADGRQWIGNQVFEKNLYESPQTFRWMKRYITNRNPARIRIDGKEITHFDAGRDFLSVVLTFAAAEANAGDEEVAFSVPVEAFEHYVDWLAEVATTAGMPRFRVIDEPSAAALGYGARIQPGDVYLVFDFGGGSLDVAVVRIEEEEKVAAGRCCRVLGKAGAEIGGMTIDQWLFQEVLRQNNRSSDDEEVRTISRELLVQCERAKERLSYYERADVTVVNYETGAALSADFTRGQFEELLENKEVFTQIDRTIRRAINDARERGYSEDDIKSVLMVGGSSLIPSVQKTIQRIFGRERVMLDRPLDAVARGAAAFVAGVDFYDHIQHDYAIRHVNSRKGSYEYRVIVKRGTPYPTKEPVARLTVKATYDGQARLGIAIFEVSQPQGKSSAQPIEIVFDPMGAARIVQVTPDEQEERHYFWMNEGSPTFLVADPPAKKGKPRFEVEFNVDGNKRLLITARDIKTGRTVLKDYPVVKLT